MGNRILVLVSAAMTASCLAAHAQDRSEQIARSANPSSGATQTDKTIRMNAVPPHAYDSNAIAVGRGFAFPPTSSPLSIIDSGALKLELRSDGQGHHALTSPLLKGMGVGGEIRRGGGVFRLSWPTSN